MIRVKRNYSGVDSGTLATNIQPLLFPLFKYGFTVFMFGHRFTAVENVHLTYRTSAIQDSQEAKFRADGIELYFSVDHFWYSIKARVLPLAYVSLLLHPKNRGAHKEHDS